MSKLNSKQLEEFILLDNQISTLYQKLKELREKKHQLEAAITASAADVKQFQHADSKFRIVETRVPESLTFKYLEKSLTTIIKNPTQVETILGFIRNNREIKTVTELKRVDKKENKVE